MANKNDNEIERELTPKTSPVTKRLDAVIRLLIEINRSKPKKAEFTEADAARLLKSVDLTPSEIAKILGKKSRTDISRYLYSKQKNIESKGDGDGKNETPPEEPET